MRIAPPAVGVVTLGRAFLISLTGYGYERAFQIHGNGSHIDLSEKPALENPEYLRVTLLSELAKSGYKCSGWANSHSQKSSPTPHLPQLIARTKRLAAVLYPEGDITSPWNSFYTQLQNTPLFCL